MCIRPYFKFSITLFIVSVTFPTLISVLSRLQRVLQQSLSWSWQLVTKGPFGVCPKRLCNNMPCSLQANNTLDTASIVQPCLIITLVICFSLGIKGLAINGLGWPLDQQPISISITTQIITSSLCFKQTQMYVPTF